MINSKNRRGNLSKHIKVESNDPEKRQERLIFKATIKPTINLAPYGGVALRGKSGEIKRRILTISAGLDKPLELEPDIFTLEGKVSYSLEEVEKGKMYKINFQNNPDAKGHFKGFLRLSTNYKEKPKIDIRIDSRFN
jgi:hypothetical protein